jgi:hypothetical protein
MKKKIISILGLTSILTSAIVCSKANAYAFDIMEDPDIIANVYVYAFNDGEVSGSMSGVPGHAFIVIENITSTPFTVGDYGVSAYETISIGTWPKFTKHSGIWYNLETNAMNEEVHNSTIYLEQTITYYDISKINNAMNKNNKWTLLKNCSTFATAVWNSFSSRTLDASLINTPTALMDSMKNYDYHSGCNIKKNSNTGYYNDEGKFISVSYSKASSSSF